MENNQTQWSEVKKIKFHHRVKRFYYKNLFRKIYTAVIIGLIAMNIFSIVKYQSFADEVQGGEGSLARLVNGETFNQTIRTVAGEDNPSSNNSNYNTNIY